jgi:hypothetical protein
MRGKPLLSLAVPGVFFSLFVYNSAPFSLLIVPALNAHIFSVPVILTTDSADPVPIHPAVLAENRPSSLFNFAFCLMPFAFPHTSLLPSRADRNIISSILASRYLTDPSMVTVCIPLEISLARMR